MVGTNKPLWITLQVVIIELSLIHYVYALRIGFTKKVVFVEWVGGNENDQEDDSSGNIYSCSSPSDTDEYVYSWESDQCEADGEFGRRLNQMVPIPVSTQCTI